MRSAKAVLLSLFVALAAASAVNGGEFSKIDDGAVNVARDASLDADVHAGLKDAGEAELSLDTHRISARGWDHCQTFS